MAPSAWDQEGEAGVLDNFAFTITKAWFGSHEKYNDGNSLLLQWEGTTDDLNTPITTVWFSIGSGWVSKDGGKSIVHESGSTEKFFVKTTQYYRIIRRCLDEFKIGALLEADGRSPFIAGSWEGFSFQMKAEEQEAIRNRSLPEGEQMQKPRDKTMPFKFLGFSGGSVSTAGASASASSSASAPAASGETPQEKVARLRAEKAAKASGAPASLKDQVIDIFKTAESFEAGQEAAFALDGVMADDDLLTSIMEEDGLWAEVQASV
jgi:hypothetical protein